MIRRHKGKQYTDHLKARLANYDRQLAEMAGLQRIKPEDDELALDIQQLEVYRANVETHYRSQVRKNAKT